MKRLIFVIFFICLLSISAFTQSIGIGTATPNSSAALDVSSSDKGFLPPRVALTATNSASPVTSPPPGLLVYNTATAGVSPFNVIPGFYYWNGSSWYPVVNKGNAFGDMQYWDGSQWVIIPKGANGSVLTECLGIPSWGGCPVLTITLNSEENEGQIQSYYPNSWYNGGNQIVIEAWTNGGQPYNVRQCLRFDYSPLPVGATIDSAHLYLYADPTPVNGNFIDAMYGPSNACYIQRITSTWVFPNPYTWNSQPAATTANQAILPQSNSSFENSVVDVTALVKDMLVNGNNGFFIKLINEVTYNSRQYLSSFSSDPTKHPKLIIKYH